MAVSEPIEFEVDADKPEYVLRVNLDIDTVGTVTIGFLLTKPVVQNNTRAFFGCTLSISSMSEVDQAAMYPYCLSPHLQCPACGLWNDRSI